MCDAQVLLLDNKLDILVDTLLHLLCEPELLNEHAPSFILVVRFALQ